MATYELDTKLSRDDVLERADAFFGDGGLGLSRQDQGSQERAWQGGGGAVFLTVHDLDRGSRVEIATREWDAPVREFIEQLPKKGIPFL
jgi:hypothetical protein